MKQSLIDKFSQVIDSLEAAFRDELEEMFKKAKAMEILNLARRRFHEIGSMIPEVGENSPWLKSMLGVSYLSGVWLELEIRGLQIIEISVMTQKALYAFSSREIPTDKLSAIRASMCSPEYVQQIAASSQKQEFVDDWVFDAVLPSADDSFKVGFAIRKCPIGLLCRRLQIERFFPYFCLNDYVIYGAMGIWLERTQTLAHGADYCDFRLTPVANSFNDIILEPEQLPEFKHCKENEIC